MTTQTDVNSVRGRNRASLLLVFVLFASPVVVAWLLFFVFPDWIPQSTSNHGILVEPVRPLPAFQLATLQGEDVDAGFLQGKWTFVYAQRGACDKACVEQLYRMRQVRLTQGKNIDRLQRLMLWDAQGVDTARRDELRQHFPGQVTAIVDASAAALLETLTVDEGDPLSARQLYLVDPLGNLMMRYRPDTDPKGIIKDLERLLKYSGLG
jgi:cytochrome oxidase Cu insertion factor (SCO1/SenC/PrrC family)